MSVSVEERLSDSFGVVAVLDDDAQEAKTVRLQLEDFDVETLEMPLDDVLTLESASAYVLGNAQALICDVQLGNLHSGVQFNGAQLVAHLVANERVPCVLTTGFVPDVGMWVRPHRAHIPVLLGRDETENPEVIIEGLRRCRTEIAEGPGPERQTHRVPLFIEKASADDEGIALDARVGGWAYKTPMRFPAWMLGDEYRDPGRARELVGKVFFAHVNLSAEREPDLYFEHPESVIANSSAWTLHFE
jgi:hypothetical protein